MKLTKEKYLDKINNSQLFKITDKTLDEYETERRYLQTKICEYFKCYSLYDTCYSLEFIEAINDSIKYFDSSKGIQFISYLSRNIKRKIATAKVKENEQDIRSGIKVADKTQKEIRLISSIINNRDWDINDTDIIEKLSNVSQFTTGEINELLQTKNLSSVLKDYNVNDDEKMSILELASDNITPESITISKVSAVETLERIENAVATLSPSKREVASQVITLMIEEFDFERMFTLKELQTYAFFNSKLYKKQQKQQVKITDTDLAKILKISKAYISKVKKEIFAQIRNNVKEQPKCNLC